MKIRINVDVSKRARKAIYFALNDRADGSASPEEARAIIEGAVKDILEDFERKLDSHRFKQGETLRRPEAFSISSRAATEEELEEKASKGEDDEPEATQTFSADERTGSKTAKRNSADGATISDPY